MLGSVNILELMRRRAQQVDECLSSMDGGVTNVSGRFAPSQIDAIFFDLDNTLVQTRAADEKTCHEVSVCPLRT